MAPGYSDAISQKRLTMSSFF